MLSFPDLPSQVHILVLVACRVSIIGVKEKHPKAAAETYKEMMTRIDMTPGVLTGPFAFPMFDSTEIEYVLRNHHGVKIRAIPFSIPPCLMGR